MKQKLEKIFLPKKISPTSLLASFFFWAPLMFSHMWSWTNQSSALQCKSHFCKDQKHFLPWAFKTLYQAPCSQLPFNSSVTAENKYGRWKVSPHTRNTKIDWSSVNKLACSPPALSIPLWNPPHFCNVQSLLQHTSFFGTLSYLL